jgi:hypothetical protein
LLPAHGLCHRHNRMAANRYRSPYVGCATGATAQRQPTAGGGTIDKKIRPQQNDSIMNGHGKLKIFAGSSFATGARHEADGLLSAILRFSLFTHTPTSYIRRYAKFGHKLT